MRACDPGSLSSWGCILEDIDLRTIAKNGGIVGINFYPYAFRKPPNGVILDTVLDHFDPMVNLIGADYLARGCDYFPDYDDWVEMQRPQNQHPVKFVVEKKNLALVTAKAARTWLYQSEHRQDSGREFPAGVPSDVRRVRLQP
jgi:microsomal dipeptidase-like Zn-dependent dipeptidase